MGQEQDQGFDLDPEQERELLERFAQVEKEPVYTLEQAEERSWNFLTELRSLNALTKKSA